MSVDNENASLQTPDSPESDAAPAPPAVAAVSPPPGDRESPASPSPAEEPPRTSERKLAANRANARKSTGPRTEQGKQRVSQNARRSIRLLGLAEAQTLNQDLGAAERLYREMIAPFEPAPALLQRHFQDLARYCMELEACERIRDALLEHRREQAALKRRRLFWEMEREMSGTLKEVFEKGLVHLPDSTGKFKEQVKCLRVLKENLEARNFDLKAVLHNLYGNDLNPEYPRAQTICIRCERLMEAEGRVPVSEEEFDNLLSLVELEYQDALTAYGPLAGPARGPAPARHRPQAMGDQRPDPEPRPSPSLWV